MSSGWATPLLVLRRGGLDAMAAPHEWGLNHGVQSARRGPGAPWLDAGGPNGMVGAGSGRPGGRGEESSRLRRDASELGRDQSFVEPRRNRAGLTRSGSTNELGVVGLSSAHPAGGVRCDGSQVEGAPSIPSNYPRVDERSIYKKRASAAAPSIPAWPKRRSRGGRAVAADEAGNPPRTWTR